MSDQGPAPWGHEGIHDDNDDGDDDVNEGDQDEQYDDDDDDDELNPEGAFAPFPTISICIQGIFF